MKPKATLAETRGLPVSENAERFVLGSILLDETRLDQVAGIIGMPDFALEKHCRIFSRMLELRARGEKIDRLTVANELMRYGDLEGIGGITYLISLDEGLPHIPNIESYAKIVRDKSALRRIAILSQHTMNRALTAEEMPGVILADVQHDIAALSLASMDDSRALNLRAVIERTPGGLNTFLKAQTNQFRMPSGFDALDDLIYGITPKKTYVIAGDTSHGKTSFALNLAQNMARAGHPGLYFTVEMSRDEMLQRMICSKAEVSLWRFSKGLCEQRERAALSFAANELADLPLYLDDTADLTATDLVVEVQRAKKKYGIKWAIVDYIQILNLAHNPVRGGKPLNEYEGLTGFSRASKMLSKVLDMAVILLSQFSKDKERSSGKVRRPILGDLHGSGAIGKDADVVCFIWRPWLHMKDRREIQHHAELIVAKHRGGPLGFVNFEFKGDYTRFYQSESQTQVQIG